MTRLFSFIVSHIFILFLEEIHYLFKRSLTSVREGPTLSFDWLSLTGFWNGFLRICTLYNTLSREDRGSWLSGARNRTCLSEISKRNFTSIYSLKPQEYFQDDSLHWCRAMEKKNIFKRFCLGNHKTELDRKFQQIWTPCALFPGQQTFILFLRYTKKGSYYFYQCPHALQV